MIKILLIEDHDMMREGMEQLIKKSNDLNVIGSVKTGKEGLGIVRKDPPDVVLGPKLPKLRPGATCSK